MVHTNSANMTLAIVHTLQARLENNSLCDQEEEEIGLGIAS